jgi:uncharacterized membrane protein
MSWFLYAILGAILYAIAEIIGKYVADAKSEPVILSILGTFYAAVLGVCISLGLHQTVF